MNHQHSTTSGDDCLRCEIERKDVFIAHQARALVEAEEILKKCVETFTEGWTFIKDARAWLEARRNKG